MAYLMPQGDQLQNYVINGNFLVSQRGGTFSTTARYTLDRWYLQHNHTSATVSQQNITAFGGSATAVRMLSTTLGAGTNFQIIQPMTSQNTLMLNSQVVTWSFLARRDSTMVGGNLVANILTSTTADQTPANLLSAGTILATSTIAAATLTTSFQLFTLVATVPANVRSIGVNFNSSGPTNGSYVEITEVKVNVGPAATPFTLAGQTEGGERMLCYRHYQKSYVESASVPTNSSSGSNFVPSANVASAANFAFVRFAPSMYKNPTVTIYSFTSSTTSAVSDGTGTDLAASSGVASNATDKGFTVTNSSGGALTASSGGFAFHWSAEAEL